MTLHSQLQEFNSKYRKKNLILLKIGVGILSLSNLVRISINLLQKFKYIGHVEEQVVKIKFLSNIEVIPGFFLNSSKYVEYTVLFYFPLITVPIYLSIYKVLLLLVGGVYTVVKLVGIFNFAEEIIKTIIIFRIEFIRIGIISIEF